MACTGAEPRAARETIDTLSTGTIVVRNAAVGRWGPSPAWTPVPVMRAGGQGDSVAVFGGIAGLAIDRLGRVFVADRQARTITVLDSMGRRVRAFGRAGQGPGELDRVTGMAWGPDEHLWVADPGNARYTLFDTAGRLVRTYPRPVLGYAFEWDGAFDDQGRLHEPSRAGGSSVYVRHRLDSTAAATPGEGSRVTLVRADSFPMPSRDESFYRIDFERGYMNIAIPYAPSLTWRFDGRDGLWIGTSDRYRIVQRALTGDTLRIVERAHTPIRLTEEERAAAERSVSVRRMADERLGTVTSPPVDLSRIPATKPVFETFVVDDSRHLWVARTTNPRGSTPSTTFDVFDPSGVFLGSIVLPVVTSPPPVIRGPRVAGISTDSLGVATVVLIRLDGR